jgi:type IV secretory pathway VirJ component
VIQLSKELPEVMQALLRGENSCNAVVVEALELARSNQNQQRLDNNPILQLHHGILDKIGVYYDAFLMSLLIRKVTCRKRQQ